MSDELLTKLREIKNEKQLHLLPEYIMKDITILGVTGTLDEGTVIRNDLKLFIQDTEPSTYNGIWLDTSSLNYDYIIETTRTNLVANSINIIKGVAYETVLFDSDVIGGLHYKFENIYITDENNDIDYTVPIAYGDGTQWIDITPAEYEIVPFATATDEQISNLLKAHYQNQIDLSTIWNVGDTRVIHLDAMTAPVAGSNKAHAAQDMTFRIIGFKHDDLTTPIGSATKAAVTIECKELLGNHGIEEYDYLSGSSDGSTYENPTYFDNAYRRTWLNTNFINALPSTFKTLVKEVIKRNLQGHSSTTNYVETNDKAFLLSYPEMFSNTYRSYRNGAALGDFEGTQYAYYNQNNSNAGRVKYVNNNGSASSAAYDYWLRSPVSDDRDYWCAVSRSGAADALAYGGTRGLAPALSV